MVGDERPHQAVSDPPVGRQEAEPGGRADESGGFELRRVHDARLPPFPPKISI